MQPSSSLTYPRAIERVVGTAAGGLIAAVVGLVCSPPLAIAGAMFPLAMLAFAVRAVDFGLLHDGADAVDRAAGRIRHPGNQ